VGGGFAPRAPRKAAKKNPKDKNALSRFAAKYPRFLTAVHIMAAARGELVNTSLIVLALGSQVPPTVANDVVVKDLLPLTGTDVRDYISSLASALGLDARPEDLAAAEGYVLGGLAFPLDHGGMRALRSRLTQLPDTLLKATS
jgi:hypothetical protein